MRGDLDDLLTPICKAVFYTFTLVIPGAMLAYWVITMTINAGIRGVIGWGTIALLVALMWRK